MQHPFSPRPCWKVAPHTGSRFPRLRCSTSPALLCRRALQHRKVAVRSPRPTPRAASDTLWARSRQGPHSEKVMPVPAAPASTARAPKGRTQRDQEAPRWPRIGHVGLQGVLGTPDLAGWPQARTLVISCFRLGGRAVWGGDWVPMVRMPTTALGHILVCHVRANSSRTW